MSKSVWSEYTKKPHFDSLQKDIECDVLVIGGGMAGVLTAYFLEKQGKKVVLVEAKEIGGGITKNTTAVITAQHDATYSELIEMHGIEKANAYLDANLQAVETFKELCKDIDCDFEIKPSYMYSLDTDLSYERDALNKLGYEAVLTDKCGLPYAIKSAVKFPDMAQFHPLKFIYSMAQNLTVYENTFITKIKDHSALTDEHVINFKQAVVASHFPFINRTGWFFIKMYQERSYVIAIKNADNIEGTFIDDKTSGFYFRNYGDLLLVGKGDHRTGTKTDAFDQLNAFANKYFPGKEVAYTWANQDCVTLDDMPYVGGYGCLKDVYTLTGFNLWGMTGSMVGAKILSDIMCGNTNEFADVFKTKRGIFRLQLLKNLGVVVLNWVRPTVRRCPHLGCALLYNRREHCWDCQCHGSRFEENGKLIDNPAMEPADSVKHAIPKD